MDAIVVGAGSEASIAAAVAGSATASITLHSMTPRRVKESRPGHAQRRLPFQRAARAEAIVLFASIVIR